MYIITQLNNIYLQYSKNKGIPASLCTLIISQGSADFVKKVVQYTPTCKQFSHSQYLVSHSQTTFFIYTGVGKRVWCTTH